MAVSGNLTTSNDRILYNITVTESNVNTANNTSDITVSVRFWRTNTGYETYGTGTCYVQIDGTEYTQAVTPSQKITNAGIVLFNRKFTISHNSDGSKTVNVKAKINISGVLSSSYQGFNVALTKIAQSPSNISTFNITAGYGNYVGLGDTITLTWSKPSGTVTGYELQYSYGTSGWQAWKNVTGTSTTVSFAGRTDIDQTGAGKIIKYRIRALNGSQASGWKESNQLIMTGGMDLKVSNDWKTGTTWINVNGTWKRAKRVWINVNGTWQYSK